MKEEKRFKKVYLEYKDINDQIYPDLVGTVKDMENNKEFNIKMFYESLNRIIVETSEIELFQMIRILPTIKLIYYFGLLYYYLIDMKKNNTLNEEYNYLSQFINYKIDIYMIVNYLRNV